MNFEDLSADLESHPITGFLHTGQQLNIPLISHIADNLYVGGCVGFVDLGDFFSHVFSLYKWEHYTVDPLTKVKTYLMYDSNDEPLRAEVDEIAGDVVDALKTGGNVLVHCQAGINRSNLIATRALMLRYDLSADDAIALLRERRSEHVLANKTFERFLLNG